MTAKTLLLRQVHPHFIQNGEIGVVAFRPNDSDHGFLSVYDGGMITAENSFQHWTGTLGNNSVGVLAVSLEECKSVELLAISNPLENFDSHIDFNAYDKKDQRTRTKALLESALARRWLHHPET